MRRIVWVRPGDCPEQVELLEQVTGLAVTLANASRLARPRISNAAVIVLELPLDAITVASVLDDAHAAASPIPVVIYDPLKALDESLIKSPMTSFVHLTEPMTTEELGRAVTMSRERFELAAVAVAEPWRQMLIGESRAIRDMHSMIRLVGPRQSTVLITGETGVGKEMVARAIHMASKRAGAKLVSVNCAAIPENLVEAELFGHSKGAFTGAVNDRVGRFEQAHRSTILLDEIGEIPMQIQPKLLRVLQEREIQRVGSSQTIQVDARVIAASNSDLKVAAAEKRFRDDLLYRLNVVPIAVPPLRDRTVDIPVLADHFLEKVCLREALPSKSLSADALRRLCDYEWPGNVRQLEYAIEMAATLSGERRQLYSGDIQLPEMDSAESSVEQQIQLRGSGVNLEEVMGRVEKLLLQEALRKCAGNKAKAASMLGIPRTTLVYKVKSMEPCVV